MAYRRSLITRSKLLYQERLYPSIAYIHHHDDREKSHSVGESPKYRSSMQPRTFGSCTDTSSGFSTLLQDRSFVGRSMTGSLLSRYMSTTVEEGTADKVEYATDVAEVLADATVETVAAQAQVVNEVAVAAADSFFLVAGLQYLIDYVHFLTGFNWWASIAVTSILIRGITVPLMINQLKSTTNLTLMRPKLEEIKEEMQNRGMSPTAVAEGQQQMKELFKKYGVTPFTPLKGLIFQGPVFISFFLAISNMVEKVPSFKWGGAFWFIDLTTPDSMYIFPVLTALTFWITVECNMQEGMEGNPAADKMKMVSRVFAALSVPLTSGFPKAIFCYWITSNLFSLVYGYVIKKPEVKKFLGVPIITVDKSAATSNPKPGLSFFESLKKFAAATHQVQAASSSASKLMSSTVEASKPRNQKLSSSSVLSQRLKGLESKVKGRKKGKKI